MLPQNPDLPVSWGVPGVYVFESRAGAAPNANNRRVLLLGYKTSAGTQPAGTPLRLLSEDDAVQGCGKGSDLHRMYRCFNAQSTSTGADIWAMPMNAPSGTAQTRLLKFLQSPTGAVLGTGNSGAVAAGFVSVWICGVRFDTQIANGDTYATIAANVAAQIQANQDFLPCTASVASDTVTLTARHTALTSADLPVMVTFSNAAMAVSASPGTITFATNAAADGSAITGIATQTAASAFLSGATANSINAGHITAVNNANAFPVVAAQPSTPGAVATLFFVADRVFNWAYTAITTAATTTMTPAWGSDASGLPSSATPSLATILGNVEQQDAFKLLVTNFTGAGSKVAMASFTVTGSTSDYSVMGAMSSEVERLGNGQLCKGSVLLFADTRSLATAGSIPAGTTPALTASPRYFMGWCPASPQQAIESAARMAALIALHLDYPPFNYAGQVLVTDSRTPYLLPHAAVLPGDPDLNAAMLTYRMAPLRQNTSGQMTIVSGRTTAAPSATLDFSYSFWGVLLADDFVRDDLRASMPASIAGKSLKNYSPSRTQYTTNADAVKTAVAARMVYYDSIDIFDGTDSLVPALAAEVNVALPTRIDVKLPKRFPIPAEQISIVTQVAS